MIKIAVDAMGGDHAPQEIVKGAIEALHDHRDLKIVLVGQDSVLAQALRKRKIANSRMSICAANDVVTMEDAPTSVVRQKKDSSLAVGVDLLKSGDVSAFISAGNTGAIMAAALLTLGTQEGIDRPALGIALPAPSGLVLFLDVGANADCRPNMLLQFAQMGANYMKRAFAMEEPRIGLLSIGEEEGKGNKLVREAHQLLKDSDLNFVGNVESRDVPKGVADVVVTDGFTGNVVIKTAEGLGELFASLSKVSETGRGHHKSISLLLKPAIKAAEKRLLDYSGHGVALLLGVNGNIIVGHGRSQAPEVQRAISMAKQVIKQGSLVALGS